MNPAGTTPILPYVNRSDASSVNRMLRIVRPDEIYNPGAQSHVVEKV